MTSYRADFAHWAEYTFDELSEYTFDWLGEPGPVLGLSASIALAPLASSGTAANHILTTLLTAYANQFSYLYDRTYEMGLLRRIEFVTGSDLDNIWGKTYELKRFYGESDNNYRKRLQIYLLQLAGSGTKAAIENIISILVEQPNSCRVDTYWPGYCRIYLTDVRALQKATDRLDLINYVLPNTLAAGVTYRFYIPYHGLDADIVLHGPVFSFLTASAALQDGIKLLFEASIYLASRSSVTFDADIVLASMPRSLLKAYMAMQDKVESELAASQALRGRVDSELEASEALSGKTEMTLQAYARLLAENQSDLDASVAIQDKRFRPIEARMMLVEA